MKLTTEFRVDASVEAAWSVLGEGFGDIAMMTSALSTSSIEGELKAGCIRTCVSASAFGPFKAGVVREQLLAFDPLTRSFEYEAIEGLPAFVLQASNRWSLHAIDSKSCFVRMDPRLKLRGLFRLLTPLIVLALKNDTQRFIEEVTYRIENQHPHPRCG